MHVVGLGDHTPDNTPRHNQVTREGVGCKLLAGIKDSDRKEIRNVFEVSPRLSTHGRTNRNWRLQIEGNKKVHDGWHTHFMLSLLLLRGLPRD